MTQQHQLYKDVFGGAKIALANSQVIFCPDFDQIEFSLLSGVELTIGTVVGTFQVGELVTGGTSAATGRVFSVVGTQMTLINVTGTFQNAETITGGTSGATAITSSLTTPNFSVQLYKSNNDITTPPDPALPVSSTNQYAAIGYQDEQGGVNYDTEHPFNSAFQQDGTTPQVLPYAQKTFKAGMDGELRGAVWVFLKISVYTSGALAYSEIDLFNNNG